MLNSEVSAALRKRWYLIVLAVAAAAGIAYGVYACDLNPQTLLRRHGYLVILIWTFFEGETIVILAGMFAEKLHLDPWRIALSAFCGSFLSDQLMFCLGKYMGKPVLRYFPRVEKNVDKVAALFEKYDIILILGFRFVYGVRNVTPILLGIGGVRHLKFFLLNCIGAAVWALSFSFGGFYAGKAFMRIMELVGHGVLYALVLGLGAGALLWYRRTKKNAALPQDDVSRDA
ncbi:MAG: DedA family protein [Desulfovibrio sp.]|jgi:membrane protein DedA with SNARE-associated domain|nr:DedA family protein [Desulfovibrio sp.]